MTAARKHPFFLLVVWSALAVLASAGIRQVASHAAVTPVVEDSPRAAAAEPQTFRAASADQDIGPGDSEPALARHIFQ